MFNPFISPFLDTPLKKCSLRHSFIPRWSPHPTHLFQAFFCDTRYQELLLFFSSLAISHVSLHYNIVFNNVYVVRRFSGVFLEVLNSLFSLKYHLNMVYPLYYFSFAPAVFTYFAFRVCELSYLLYLSVILSMFSCLNIIVFFYKQ